MFKILGNTLKCIFFFNLFCESDKRIDSTQANLQQRNVPELNALEARGSIQQSVEDGVFVQI